MKKTISLLVFFVSFSSLVFAYQRATFIDDESNIREEPSAKAKLLEVSKKGSTCEVIEQKGNWFKVKYNGNKYGWTYKDNISIEKDSKPNNTANPDNPDANAPVVTMSGKAVFISDDNNVRSEPDSEAKLIAKPSKGESCEILAKKSLRWYKIKFGRNQIGWTHRLNIKLEENNQNSDATANDYIYTQNYKSNSTTNEIAKVDKKESNFDLDFQLKSDVLETKDGWMKVKQKNGKTEWVKKKEGKSNYASTRSAESGSKTEGSFNGFLGYNIGDTLNTDYEASYGQYFDIKNHFIQVLIKTDKKFASFKQEVSVYATAITRKIFSLELRGKKLITLMGNLNPCNSDPNGGEDYQEFMRIKLALDKKYNMTGTMRTWQTGGRLGMYKTHHQSVYKLDNGVTLVLTSRVDDVLSLQANSKQYNDLIVSEGDQYKKELDNRKMNKLRKQAESIDTSGLD